LIAHKERKNCGFLLQFLMSRNKIQKSSIFVTNLPSLNLHLMTFKFLPLAAMICSIALFFSCKKDGENEKESPFLVFFNESAIVIDTVEQAADTWDYGFVFTPLKDGAVTHLGLKLPTTGGFKVTLWDLSGPTPMELSSKTINSAVKNESASSEIPETALKAGKKYGLSILANTFFRLTKADNSAFTFPRTEGNIRIESFNEAVNTSSLASFPSGTNDTRVAPCVDVIFIAD
jgi:hypothetical protein